MLQHLTLADLDAAAALLRAGRVLAYPTEAVFGLGCEPHDHRAFNAALVSTSANPHRQPPARAASVVAGYSGDRLDGWLDAPLGGQTSPTMIRDALSGAVIRV